jgi:hypothetical protein
MRNSPIICHCAEDSSERASNDTGSPSTIHLEHHHSFDNTPALVLPVPYHLVVFETGKLLYQRYADSNRTPELGFLGMVLRYNAYLVREIHAAWIKSTPDPRWLTGEEYDQRKRLMLKTSLAPSDSISQAESIESGGDNWREGAREDLLYDEAWRSEVSQWVHDVQCQRTGS